ncbi:hypothetical protein BDW67DRAFT_164329 [Aspergillus spinulosporus]
MGYISRNGSCHPQSPCLKEILLFLFLFRSTRAPAHNWPLKFNLGTPSAVSQSTVLSARNSPLNEARYCRSELKRTRSASILHTYSVPGNFHSQQARDRFRPALAALCLEKPKTLEARISHDLVRKRSESQACALDVANTRPWLVGDLLPCPWPRDLLLLHPKPRQTSKQVTIL